MSNRRTLAGAGRVIALTIVLYVCYAVAGTIAAPMRDAQTAEQQRTAALALLLVCVLQTVVLARVVLRSRWHGWRLMAALFVVFYGVMTLMSQMESAVFLTGLPAGMLPRLFLMGALIAAPFSVAAVLILGKRRAAAGDTEPNDRLVMPAGEWSWKLAAIAVVYVTLYFTFGYFVAWQSPAVREYYTSGTDVGRMTGIASNRLFLMPFQALRGLMWAALALPVVRMLKGTWLETAVTLALLFSVVMNAQLLLPNPLMPEAVRMAHLVETASSNFLFGLFVGWLLSQRHQLLKVSVATG